MNLLSKLLCASLFLSPLAQATISQEKAQAALLNAAIGDALGRITEFVDTTDEIYAKFGKNGVTNLKQAFIKHPTDFKTFAPYTDDTVMSVIMLEVAQEAQKNEWTIDNFLEQLFYQFTVLFSDRKELIDPLYHVRAHGPTNIHSIKNILGFTLVYPPCSPAHFIKNISWDLKKHSDQSSWKFDEVRREGGCGSVMRVWPLGLMYADNISLLTELADKQSQITHRHPMARAACVAMAVGTAYAYQGKSVDEIVAAMISAAQKFDKEEREYKTKDAALTTCKNSADLNALMQNTMLTSEMIRYAYNAAKAGKTPHQILGTHNKKQSNHRSPDGILLGWAADEAVAAAVYLFVRHSDNPQQAIIEGVNTPGDSDSIASLAGALVGAYSGKVYQDKDISYLENYEQLKQLAQQI